MDQQQQAGAWYTATIATAVSLWQAFVVPTALAVYAVIKFRASRKDAATQTATALSKQAADREAAEAEDLDRLRISLDARTQAWIERLEKELEDQRSEKDVKVAALEIDRNRGWNLARFWFAEFLQVLHWMRSARSAAEGMWNRLKTYGKAREETMALWPADRPSATMGLEDPIPPKGEP